MSYHARRTGIILKLLKGNHKVALLDYGLGRIDAIVRVPVCVGSLLEYTVEREQGNFVYLSDLSIIGLPFLLGRADIHFWHHVLELCYFFVPVGTQANELFTFLHCLYAVENAPNWSIQSKKIYLFKLLTAIGLYTELPLLPRGNLYHLIDIPTAEIMHLELDDASERILDTWLQACVAQHPAIKQFNTVYFLLNQHSP